MICSKCGNFNNENASYCANCGNPLSNNKINTQTGSITFIRPNSFFGCLIPFEIYIDNLKVASLPNNSNVSIPVTYGQHLITLKQLLNKGQYNVTVLENQKYLTFECKLKLGFFVNHIVINLLNFHN